MNFCNLLCEGAPAKCVSRAADDGSDGVAVALEVPVDGLLTETVKVVVVDTG